MSDARHIPNGVATLGEAIRTLREASGKTLRGLAREVSVTPAFLSDLEKNRRSTDKLDGFAAALQVPVGELKKLDPRVSTDLREWLGTNPALKALLEEIRASGRPVPVDALRAALLDRKK